jgi:hypothetical protein
MKIKVQVHWIEDYSYSYNGTMEMRERDIPVYMQIVERDGSVDPDPLAVLVKAISEVVNKDYS